jgi:hypothetical protein
MGSSEFLAISDTGHFGPSEGEDFLAGDVVFWEHQLHCTLLWCKEVEREMSTFRVREKNA